MAAKDNLPLIDRWSMCIASEVQLGSDYLQIAQSSRIHKKIVITYPSNHNHWNYLPSQSSFVNNSLHPVYLPSIWYVYTSPPLSTSLHPYTSTLLRYIYIYISSPTIFSSLLQKKRVRESHLNDRSYFMEGRSYGRFFFFPSAHTFKQRSN